MTNYARMYRFGVTPWERYGKTAEAGMAALFDREEAERSRPLGRALDLGCGRGWYTRELARRGWDAVGIDYVPEAVAAAERDATHGSHFVVGDVTHLPEAELGHFGFFLDIGCIQGLDAAQQQAEGRGVTALANPGATMLILAFGPTRMRSVLGGMSREDVEAALPGWVMLTVEPAATAGLGWPMNRTAPRWYRLRRRADDTAPDLPPLR